MMKEQGLLTAHVLVDFERFCCIMIFTATDVESDYVVRKTFHFLR